MNNISFKISDNELIKLNSYLSDYLIKSNELLLAVFKYKGATISIYKSLKVIIQGNTSLDIYKELILNNLIEDKNIDLKNNEINIINENKNNIIGSDEVGVGDFFGGMVATACFVRSEDVQYLKNIGVKDSKRLTDKKMQELFPQIIKKVKYITKYITPKEYNKLYDQYQNSHIIKTKLHNEALTELIIKFNLSNFYVVMDEYCSANNYDKYLKVINSNQNTKIDLFIPKAENYFVAVACASIIARIYFLKQIEFLNDNIKDLDIKIKLGNNNEVQEIAAELYKKDKKIFNNLVKKHFITYNKIVGVHNE